MYYPTIGEWVRVSGRVEEYAIISADYAACLAGTCLHFDGMAVEESVPFSMLLESTEYDGAQSEANAHASQLAIVKQVLHSTLAHIHRSIVLIADIRNSISTTLQIICTSQRLISESDLVIDRTQTLDCK